MSTGPEPGPVCEELWKRSGLALEALLYALVTLWTRSGNANGLETLCYMLESGSTVVPLSSHSGFALARSSPHWSILDASWVRCGPL